MEPAIASRLSMHCFPTMYLVQQHEDDVQRRTLQQTIESLNNDIGRLQDRSQAAEQSMVAMRAQHEAAMADMTAKTAEATTACEQLDEARHRAAHAEASSEKALQVCPDKNCSGISFVAYQNPPAFRESLYHRSSEPEFPDLCSPRFFLSMQQLEV